MLSLCDYLAAAARSHPGQTAIRHKGQGVSYEDLDRASSAFASALARAGVQPDDRIAVWVNKSIEAVTAIHGILRAGAAYVPIDPVAPVARAQYIIEDCRGVCLITSTDRLALLDAGFLRRLGLTLVILTDEGGSGAALAGVPVVAWSEATGPPPALRPGRGVVAGDDRLAYILYTSGHWSTIREEEFFSSC